MMGLDPGAVEGFLKDLKALVASGDRDGVCALLGYPLKAHKPVASAAACKGGYDQIFTAPVTAAIAEQRFAELFVNSEGVMIGSGEVWFAGICKDPDCKVVELKIRTVNN
jgi:hypothetical protein